MKWVHVNKEGLVLYIFILFNIFRLNTFLILVG
jgi:hypothetical protein